jgi:hypothetical protein
MGELLDHRFVHALDVVEGNPGPEHADHYAVFFTWVLEDVEKRLSRKSTVTRTDVTFELADTNRTEARS